MIRSLLKITLWAAILSWFSAAGAPEPMKALRFDRQLFRAIETQSSDSIDRLYLLYPRFMPLYVDEVIKQSRTTVIPFFTNPELQQLYRDALSRFTDLSELEQALGNAFARLNREGHTAAPPTLLLHVSGLNQSIVVGEGFLSISIDKYLGVDYPLYRRFLYDYQFRQMVPAKILPDCLRAWLYSEYPLGVKEKNLLEYMLYEGRIFALLEKILPADKLPVAFGYTSQEWEWAEKNERKVYETLVANKQLNSQDPALIARYINEGPSSSFVSADAPDRLGLFIGWKVARRWMDQHPQATPAEIMSIEARSLLETSQYKP